MKLVEELLGRFAKWWEGYAYPPQETAALGQLLLLALGVIVILFLWLRYMQSRGMPLWLPATGSLMAVSLFVMTIHLQRSFFGTPDERCHLYQNGELVFELVSGPMLVEPARSTLESEKILLLIVRASKRWGDQEHICSLSASSALARQLMKSFSQLPQEGDSAGISISFTFGNGAVAPNVTWDQFQPPPEKGEPQELGDDI